MADELLALHAVYFEGLRLKSLPWSWLSWLRYCVVYFSPSRQILL